MIRRLRMKLCLVAQRRFAKTPKAWTTIPVGTSWLRTTPQPFSTPPRLSGEAPETMPMS